MNKEHIKNVIVDQREDIANKLQHEKIIQRDGVETCGRYLNEPNVLLVSGLRRAGKSIFAHLMLKGKEYVFLNFDDERLIDVRTEDLDTVMQCFHELYGEFNYILFDEIQNVRGWELFVNRLRNKYRIIITGSNANLLSRELATHLTGRHVDFVLFPLNFREYMSFNDVKLESVSLYSTKQRSILSGLLDKYLKGGGMFEYYKFGKEFLRNLWSSVIAKDITTRHNVRRPQVIENLSALLLNYFASIASVNNISRHLDVKSPHTISKYVKYLEDSFLIFTVKKFSFKVKEQISTFKKVYITDNGLVDSLSFQFTENRGKYLENLVAIELKRRSYREDFELFYWNNYYVECDFIVKRGRKVTTAIQVCSDLNINNKKREVNGLIGALKEFDLKNGVIVTESTEDELSVNGYKIQLIPAWKWLLQS